MRAAHFSAQVMKPRLTRVSDPFDTMRKVSNRCQTIKAFQGQIQIPTHQR